MNKMIRIGTRKSALAMVQTELVAEALKRVQPGLLVETVTKVTEGDRILNKPAGVWRKGRLCDGIRAGAVKGRD